MPFLNEINYLWALGAIPILTLIYLLHRRIITVKVSGLWLWQHLEPRRRSGGGLKRQMPPRTYYLELLIITLLALAAAAPFIPGKTYGGLTVVLDNSFSMRAGDSNSARSRSLTRLQSEIRKHTGQIRYILAGSKPRLISVGNNRQLKPGQWTCNEPESRLTDAIALARKHAKAPVLVLTDQLPPPQAKLPDNIRWLSFGKRRSNLAIINAVRKSDTPGDRCLVELASYADSPGEVILKAIFPETNIPGRDYKVMLQPGKSQTLNINLPKGAKTVKFNLPQDELIFDNQVTLLPYSQKPVSVGLNIYDSKLKQAVIDALRANGASITNRQPEILITDNTTETTIIPPAQWRVIFQGSGKPRVLIGPYTVNRNAALLEGLSFNGLLWDVGSKQTAIRGTPLVIAGDTTLISRENLNENRRIYNFKFRPAYSTFQSNPNWPAMFCNLLNLRLNSRPGWNRVNCLSGDEVVFTPPLNGKASIVFPDKKSHAISFTGPLQFIPTIRGIYSAKVDKKKYQLSVSTLSATESDLRGLGYSEISGRDYIMHLQRSSFDISWALLLAALILLIIHLLTIRKYPGI